MTGFRALYSGCVDERRKGTEVQFSVVVVVLHVILSGSIFGYACP
jgi:hypothetical protein